MLQTLILLAKPALIGGITLFAFGYIWYSVIFKNYFMKLRGEAGMNRDVPTKQQMIKVLGIHLILNILTAAAFALVCYPDAPYKLTALITFIIWIGFTLPQIMSAYLWDNRSGKYTAFEVIYSLLSFVILAGAIRLVFAYLM